MHIMSVSSYHEVCTFFGIIITHYTYIALFGCLQPTVTGWFDLGLRSNFRDLLPTWPVVAGESSKNCAAAVLLPELSELSSGMRLGDHKGWLTWSLNGRYLQFTDSQFGLTLFCFPGSCFTLVCPLGRRGLWSSVGGLLAVPIGYCSVTYLGFPSKTFATTMFYKCKE